MMNTKTFLVHSGVVLMSARVIFAFWTLFQWFIITIKAFLREYICNAKPIARVG